MPIVHTRAFARMDDRFEDAGGSAEQGAVTLPPAIWRGSPLPADQRIAATGHSMPGYGSGLALGRR